MGSQPSAPAASAAAHADAGTYVAASSDIADGGRIQRCVQGRYVTILRVRGVLRAIDSICFHAGGELGLGDIEDINGKACLTCPLHEYHVDIATGEHMTKAFRLSNGRLEDMGWQSQGVSQRVHTVSERGGHVYLTLSQSGAVGSDAYAYSQTSGERIIARGRGSTR